MTVDVSLLEECPVLSEYEKNLISRIGVNHETQASVAVCYGKTPSTISVQHKKALEKLDSWLKRREEPEKRPSMEDLDKEVFGMLNRGVPPNVIVEKLGHVDRVMKLCKQHRMLMDDDYRRALSNMVKCGFEPRRDSRYPLLEVVDDLIAERQDLFEEKSEIWNRLEEKGFTEGLDRYEYRTVNEAFKRFLEHVLEETEWKEYLENKLCLLWTLHKRGLLGEDQVNAITTRMLLRRTS